jgi:uncharacterized protein (DUF58 family)
VTPVPPVARATARPTPALLVAVGVGVFALGLGLVTGRPDVALLGVPLLAGVALGLLSRSSGPSGALEVAPLGTVDQGAPVRIALRLAVPGAELVAVRLPAGRRVPLGEFLLLRGGVRDLGCTVTVVGRGRVVLARPDWVAVPADGLTAVGPVTGPEAAALALPAADRLPPSPLPPRPAGFAGAHRTRRPGEGSELVDVRAFQPGDRLRRVDWRVSARRSPGLEQLYVRRTYADADADVLLHLDTRVDVGTDASLWAVPPDRDPAGTPVPGSSLDLAVRAAASLAAAQLQLGDRVGFVDLANRWAWLRPGSGRRQLLALQVRLAATRTNPNATSGVVRPERLPRGAVAVVLSPLLDDAVAAVALDALRGGAHVLCIDVLPDPVVADLAVEHGRAALDRVLADQAARRARLEAAGIPVLRWEPATVAAHLTRWSARPPAGVRR